MRYLLAFILLVFSLFFTYQLNAQWSSSGGLIKQDPTGNDVLIGGLSITGGGSKSFWDNDRRAFRSGQLSFEPTYWDTDSLGIRSAAFGLDVKATGDESFAIGRRSEAFGTGSFASGFATKAFGFRSTASGVRSRSIGNTSYAFGEDVTAEADNSVIFGNGRVGISNHQVNDIENSFMVAFRGSEPTFFVGPAASSSSGSGFVGIGTKFPASDLDVHGNGIIRASASIPKLELFDSGPNDRTEGIIQLFSDDLWLASSFGGISFLTENGSGDGGSTGRMTIHGVTGDVGIGIGSSVPAQKLEISGAIKIGSSTTNTNGSIRYDGTNFQGHHNGTWKNLDEAGGTSVWTLSGSDAHFTAGRIGIGTTSPNSRLHIDALSGQNPLRAAIAGQTKFHISSNGGASIGTPSAPPGNGLAVSGSTGIGTTVPTQKLDVIGAIRIGTTTSNVNGSIRYDGFNFQGHHNGTWINLDEQGGGSTQVWTQSGSEASYTSGNVGIGTNNPEHLLHVNGDIAVAGFILGPSDERLKEDIRDLSDALEIVNKIQPRTYRHKDNLIASIGLAYGQQYGFIAQELERLLPSLVIDNTISDKDGNKYKGINHQQMIPILTQAIKELSEENAALKRQQTAHAELISSILSRIENLEKQD